MMMNKIFIWAPYIMRKWLWSQFGFANETKVKIKIKITKRFKKS